MQPGISVNSSKRALMVEMLLRGNVLVTFVPNPDNVLPSFIKEVASFEYGHDMPFPIPDLDLAEEGIYATLAFDHVPISTFVAWDAVSLMSNMTEAHSWATTKPKPEEREEVTQVGFKHPRKLPSTEAAGRLGLRVIEGGKQPDKSPTPRAS